MSGTGQDIGIGMGMGQRSWRSGRHCPGQDRHRHRPEVVEVGPSLSGTGQDIGIGQRSSLSGTGKDRRTGQHRTGQDIGIGIGLGTFKFVGGRGGRAVIVRFIKRTVRTP